MGTPRAKKTDTAAASASATPATAPTFVYSLESVIEATKNDSFVYTASAFHDPLIKSGDVEINKTLENDAGEFATRATAKHLQQNESTNTVNQTVTIAPASADKPKFEVESGVAIPEFTRKSSGLRAGRSAIYPFDNLAVGQSFFVPNVGDKVAAKAMASTVAGANVRFSEEIPGVTRVNRKGVTVPATKQLRKFKIFDTVRTIQVDGVDTVQKGARVFRVEVPAAEAAGTATAE